MTTQPSKPGNHDDPDLDTAIRLADTAWDIAERKPDEKSLRDSEERFRTLAALAPAGIYLADTTGRCLYANPGWLEMAGMTLAEAMGMGWNKALHPDDRTAVLEAWQRTVACKGTWDLEYRFQTPSGKVTRVLGQAAPVLDAAGKIIGYVGINTDITERKRAEEALRETEARLTQVVAAGNVGLWDWDLATNRVRFSREWKRQIGYEEHEITDSFAEWRDRVHPDDLARTLEQVHAFIERPWPNYTSEFRLRHKDGSYRWILAQASLLCDGNGKRMLGSHVDVTDRKCVEESLRSLSRHLSLAQIIGNTGSFEYSLAENKVTWSEGLYRIFGIDSTIAPLTYEQVLEMVHVDDREMHRLQTQNIVERGHYDFEHRLIRPDGETRWIAGCGEMEYAADGTPLRMLGTVQDITERKRAVTALSESEATHRALIDGLPDIVMRFDRDARHLFASRNVDSVVDLPADQFIGKTHRELGFSTEMCEFWESAIRDVFESGKPLEREFSFPGKHGLAVFNWRLLPELDAQGAIRSVISISRDVTAHRRAERDYQTLFREMLNGFALHEIICNDLGEPVDYRFLAVNPAFERMTGLKGDAIVGKTVLEVLPEIERHWIETYGRVAIDGEPVSFENYSHELDQHFAVTAFQPAAGQFACIIADITERKRAEEAQRQLDLQMMHTQKLESLGVLAGGIAHDFNNILVGIRMFADSLQPDAASPATIVERAAEIKKAVTRGAELTRQILTYAGKGPTRLEPLNLSHIVDDMRNMLAVAVSKRATLKCRLASDLPAMQADAGQMRQVIMNLVVNASEALGNNDGVISLFTGTARVDDDHPVRGIAGKLLPPGEYVCLEVADTGCGMDQATVEKIFDLFFTTKFAGRGLGLATVYGIVQMHKGAIQVSSKPGQGSTFRVLLPASDLAPISAEETTDVMLPQCSGTVLVVDDEEMVRKGTEVMFQCAGFSVLLAGDGPEALELYRRHGDAIDCVVLDLTMPKMSGEEVLRELRRINPTVRVIVTSGYTAEAMKEQLAGQEVFGFVQKPDPLDTIIVELAKAL